MSTVFITGSRSISKLNDEAIKSLNRIMAQGFRVVIGDSYGVDIAVQKYFKTKGYTKVTVYHVQLKPRNNAGFPTKYVPSPNQTHKNTEMAKLADYGLAIWDGHSRGTADSITKMNDKGIHIKVIYQVTQATTLFCRAGTHPRKPDYHDRPVPDDMPRCTKCLEPRTPEQLKAWDGQPLCPPYSVYCMFNQAVTG